MPASIFPPSQKATSTPEIRDVESVASAVIGSPAYVSGRYCLYKSILVLDNGCRIRVDHLDVNDTILLIDEQDEMWNVEVHYPESADGARGEGGHFKEAWDDFTPEALRAYIQLCGARGVVDILVDADDLH